ncbi:MAG: autotransporter-associated beta strand repeat-containing protein [Pontibacterium sp.]
MSYITIKRQVTASMLLMSLTGVSQAGHLFTQAGANTPTWMQAGQGISIDQGNVEFSSGGGAITFNFSPNSSIPAAADTSTNDWWQWSAGDVLKFSVETTAGTYTKSLGYDTTCTADICGVTGSSSLYSSDPLIGTSDLQSTTNITWTVQALAGDFSLAGYRIYFKNGTLNGAAAGALDQSSVIDSSQLGGGTPTIPDIDTAKVYTSTELSGNSVNPVFDGGTLQVADPDSTITTALTVNATNGTIDSKGNDATFSGDFTGPGNITKTGLGTITLSGSNSHNTTTVTGGTVQIASDTNLGTGDLTLNGGKLATTATLAMTRNIALGANHGEIDTADGTTLTSSGVLSGAANLAKSGAGTLQLDGTNTYSGTTTVTAGTIQVASDANLGTGDLTLNGGKLATTATLAMTRNIALGANHGEIDTADGTTLTSSGVLSGAANLAKSGAGTLQLDGTNTYSGTTTVTAGTIQVASDANLGTGDLILNGGKLATTADLTTTRAININANSEINVANNTTLTSEGELSGAAELLKSGNGILFLKGSTTYTGDTTIDGGILKLATNKTLGTGVVTLNGGTLQVADSDTISAEFALDENNGTIDSAGNDTTFSGDLSGNGDLTKKGEGVLTLAGSNSYTGDTTVTAGTLQVSSDTNLGADTSNITLDGGTLASTASMSTSRNINLGAGNGEIAVADGTTFTSAGTLTGTSTLNKSGTGTLQLSGASTAGNAAVNDGVLQVEGSLAAATIRVANGATLGGSGALAGNVTVNGILSPGSSPGTLTVAGDVTQTAASTYLVEIDGATYSAAGGAGSYDRVVLTGATSVFTADGTLTPVLRGITGAATNSFTPAVGDNFRIVTTANAAGVAGEFTSVTNPVAGLADNTRLDVLYGTNFIDLYITPESFAITGIQNAVDAGTALDSIRPSAGVRTATTAGDLFSGLYGLNDAQVAHAVLQASGEIHAFALNDLRAGIRTTSSGLTSAIHRKAVQQNLWFDVSAYSVSYDDDETASAHHGDTRHLWVGNHFLDEDSKRAGVALGYSDSSVSGTVAGSADRKTTTLAAYYTRTSDNLVFDGALGLAHSASDIERNVALSTGTTSNSARATTNALFGNLGMGMTYALSDKLSGTAWARLNAEYMDAHNYAESGSEITALTAAQDYYRSAQTSLGYRLSGLFNTAKDTGSWVVDLGVAKALGGDSQILSRTMSLHGVNWDVHTTDTSDLSTFIKAGVNLPLGQSSSLGFHFNASRANGWFTRSGNLVYSIKL